MKKLLSTLLAALLLVGCLSACGEGKQSAANGDAIQIVTTIFPEYDWVMNILGENPSGAEVTMLLDTGVDLHSFQPTAKDVLKVSTCDLFIYVGGESDAWAEDALRGAENKDMLVVNLLDALGDAVKEEELVEGMQEDEHGEGGEQEEEETEYDEHVWLSLKNAAALVKSISAAIRTVDPAEAETYRKNTEAYVEKLNALDAEFSAAVAGASVSTLLFGDRFPFRYLTDDYGLSYYAAFVGCSAESEASFETVAFLSKKVDELGLHAVMTIEGSDHRLAETIIQNTRTKDQRILTLDSLQSTTAKDVADGASYLSVMRQNLNVLKDALRQE